MILLAPPGRPTWQTCRVVECGARGGGLPKGPDQARPLAQEGRRADGVEQQARRELARGTTATARSIGEERGAPSWSGGDDGRRRRRRAAGGGGGVGEGDEEREAWGLTSQSKPVSFDFWLPRDILEAKTFQYHWQCPAVGNAGMVSRISLWNFSSEVVCVDY